MCSRLVLGIVAVLLFVGTPASAQLGGRGLEFSVNAGWTDFDEEIRFEDDASVSATVLAEVLPFFSMGLELGRVGARDRVRDEFHDVIVVSVRGRVEPWRERRLNGGMLLGVTFVAFENRPNIDSVSEGFEFGGSGRWNIDTDWRVRFDAILRLQTVSRPVLDDAGIPTGDEEEIGFVWSQVYRVGVGRGF